MMRRKIFGIFVFVLFAMLSPTVFAALPSTSNYKLNSFGFGSGGTAGSSTSNYSLEGTTGELSGSTASTSTYSTKPGYEETQQANVPTVTLTNPGSYYDKLHFVIDEQNNPTDAKYALQISTTSDFSSNISYVKNDLTIGATLTTADYQTYTTWGGVGGANIIGLTSNTTYYIRAKATQGNFTESAYGPSSSASTVGQQLTFCVDNNVNSSCDATSSVSFSGLLAGNVANGSSNIETLFATNANSGGEVYVYSANGGLKTTSAGNYTITSATADLSSVNEGFGAQIASVGQTSGGPLSKVSPFNGSSENVGSLSTSVASMLTTSSAIVGGNASIQLKAKPSATTPAATDYAETLTLIAAASF